MAMFDCLRLLLPLFLVAYARWMGKRMGIVSSVS